MCSGFFLSKISVEVMYVLLCQKFASPRKRLLLALVRKTPKLSQGTFALFLHNDRMRLAWAVCSVGYEVQTLAEQLCSSSSFTHLFLLIKVLKWWRHEKCCLLSLFSKSDPKSCVWSPSPPKYLQQRVYFCFFLWLKGINITVMDSSFLDSTIEHSLTLWTLCWPAYEYKIHTLWPYFPFNTCLLIQSISKRYSSTSICFVPLFKKCNQRRRMFSPPKGSDMTNKSAPHSIDAKGMTTTRHEFAVLFSPDYHASPFMSCAPCRLRSIILTDFDSITSSTNTFLGSWIWKRWATKRYALLLSSTKDVALYAMSFSALKICGKKVLVCSLLSVLYRNDQRTTHESSLPFFQIHITTRHELCVPSFR